jgi:hypothetical protein
VALQPLDYEEIRALTARYNFGIDLGDAEACADCYTADGVFHIDSPLFSAEHPMGGISTGRDELVAYYGRCFEQLRGMMRHWNNGTQLIEGNGDTATMKSYMMSLRVGWADGEAGVVGTGIYFDELRRVDGAWKFTLRRWVSDPQPEHIGNAFAETAAPDLA